MKNQFKLLLILFLFSLNSLTSLAQSDSIINTYQLPREQFSAWNTIYETWMKEEYWKILEDNQIKLSCASCTYCYIDVVLNIDKSGKLITYKIEKENICGGKATVNLQKRFLKYFEVLIFPEVLRNKSIRAKLGNGLKC